MCLPLQHCDTVIPHRYPGFSLEGLSEASGVIEGDEVMMHATDKAGSVYSVTFDKTPALVNLCVMLSFVLKMYRCQQILKRDILLPETTKRSVSEFANYPPRVLICVQQTQVSSCVESSPEVKILGLDREWTFPLLLGQAVRRTAVPNDGIASVWLVFVLIAYMIISITTRVAGSVPTITATTGASSVAS